MCGGRLIGQRCAPASAVCCQCCCALAGALPLHWRCKKSFEYPLLAGLPPPWHGHVHFTAAASSRQQHIHNYLCGRLAPRRQVPGGCASSGPC